MGVTVVPGVSTGGGPYLFFVISGTLPGRTYPTPLADLSTSRKSHLAGNSRRRRGAPERETLDVRRLRPHPETEMTAMRVVMDHEAARGCKVYDVHEQNLGYDVTSLDLQSGELRLIEVKGLAGPTGSILLTPNERRVAEDRRDCYWLYVVPECATAPHLQQPIPDPAGYPWHEVTKVAHYFLNVNALQQPMEIRETERGYNAEPKP